MPELPDVATFERYLDATALHKTIAGVEVRDDRLLHEVTADELGARLVGRTFAGSRRHGNVLFALLDGEVGGALALHFGMTGTLRYYRRADAEPEHARVVIRFANDFRLAIVSQRLLGEIRLADDVDTLVRNEDLGPDALRDLTDPAAFRAALAGHHGMVKPALMNQSILAGIGNVYSDEILFQARLDPRTSLDALDDAALGELFHDMRGVLEEAIRHGAEAAEFPGDWLTPHREAGEPCPRCGATIERVEVSGRGAYLCPSCQRRRSEGQEAAGG